MRFKVGTLLQFTRWKGTLAGTHTHAPGLISRAECRRLGSGIYAPISAHRMSKWSQQTHEARDNYAGVDAQI